MAVAELFFATGNDHKIREIEEILGDEFVIRTYRDLPEKPDVEETEDTLKGNALLKASHFFKLVQIPAFADDTGLEVDALNGAPGVKSARYAGESADSEQNIRKLLKEMQGQDKRSARFRTVIAFVSGGREHFFEGVLEGKIGIEKRGSGGFGYDPVFIPEGFDKSLAELGSEKKNEISHRGKAVRKFAEFISGR